MDDNFLLITKISTQNKKKLEPVCPREVFWDLGPVLYLLYINDLSETLNCTIATFADDTAIMATGNTLDEPTTKLQRAADDIVTWTRKWRIKLNETKPTYINFTNQKIDQRSILLNGVRIPPANTAKYRGMTLDAKLRRKAHNQEETRGTANQIPTNVLDARAPIRNVQ
jgi:hypothetical protein